METFRKDSRSGKVNLGIALYYDETGQIPLLEVSFVPAFAFANQPAIDLAERMAAVAPGAMKDACKIWFGVTGTDAGDSAIKLARAYFVGKAGGVAPYRHLPLAELPWQQQQRGGRSRPSYAH